MYGRRSVAAHRGPTVRTPHLVKVGNTAPLPYLPPLTHFRFPPLLPLTRSRSPLPAITPSPGSQINGKSLFTVRDLKDFGTNTATSSTYSLKGTHNGLIKPSPDKYKIEIVKYCDNSDCSRIPEPSSVFVSPQGHVVFSVWSVGQSLRVNGVLALNHAWCPVRSAATVQ